MNKLWLKQSLSDAVDKPRLHTQLAPDQDVSYEEIPFDSSGKYRMSREILEGLEKRGHNVTGVEFFAAVQAVFRDPEKGIFAKSDRRKHGAPAGQQNTCPDGDAQNSRSIMMITFTLVLQSDQNTILARNIRFTVFDMRNVHWKLENDQRKELLTLKTR